MIWLISIWMNTIRWLTIQPLNCQLYWIATILAVLYKFFNHFRLVELLPTRERLKTNQSMVILVSSKIITFFFRIIICYFRIQWGEARQDISFNAVHGSSSSLALIDLQLNTTLSDPEITLTNDDSTIRKILIKTFEKFAHSFDERYRKEMPKKKEWINQRYNRNSLQKWYEQMRKTVPRRMFKPLILF